MPVAKVLNTPNGQTILLPEEFSFASAFVEFKRMGPGLMLIPIEDLGRHLQTSLNSFEPDFKIDRNQPNF
jgi:antitoxin VapB